MHEREINTIFDELVEGLEQELQTDAAPFNRIGDMIQVDLPTFVRDYIVFHVKPALHRVHAALNGNADGEALFETMVMRDTFDNDDDQADFMERHTNTMLQMTAASFEALCTADTADVLTEQEARLWCQGLNRFWNFYAGLASMTPSGIPESELPEILADYRADAERHRNNFGQLLCSLTDAIGS